LDSFFISQLVGSHVLNSRPGLLSPGSGSGTHCTGGYLGPTGGHDILEKGRHSCRTDTRSQHLPARNVVALRNTLLRKEYINY